MLGVVFTEFLEMVEDRFSPEVVDAIIDRASLPHDGAYTAVGEYPHEEIVALVVALAAEIDTPVPILLEVFGRHLFGRLAAGHPGLMAGGGSLFDLLARLDDHIHPEVLKLYPKAQLPRFSVASRDADGIVLRYDSPRRMESLAVGLVHGAGDHFGERVEVGCTEVAGDDPHVLIHVRKSV